MVAGVVVGPASVVGPLAGELDGVENAVAVTSVTSLGEGLAYCMIG
jgi:hypothetical protein